MTRLLPKPNTSVPTPGIEKKSKEEEKRRTEVCVEASTSVPSAGRNEAKKETNSTVILPRHVPR